MQQASWLVKQHGRRNGQTPYDNKTHGNSPHAASRQRPPGTTAGI